MLTHMGLPGPTLALLAGALCGAGLLAIRALREARLKGRLQG